MRHMVRLAASQAIAADARRWGRGCLDTPTWRDMLAVSTLLSSAKEDGWDTGALHLFASGEVSTQATALTTRRGYFAGAVTGEKGLGATSDGLAGSFYDLDQTLAQIPGVTPGRHVVLVGATTDEAGDADIGASGGGSQMLVRRRSSLGQIAVRACNTTIYATACASSFGIGGYAILDGVTYFVTRVVLGGGVEGLDLVPSPLSTPTVTFPSSSVRIWQEGTGNSWSRNRALGTLINGIPPGITTLAGLKAWLQRIDRAFERVLGIYGTRDEVYTLLHQASAQPPWPFTRGSRALAQPPGVGISRLGQPAFSDSVTNATHSLFPYDLPILTPNAPIAYDATNSTDLQHYALGVWANRALGEIEGQVLAPNLRGNNTYGAIPTPRGFGRQAYHTHAEANLAMLAALLEGIGGLKRNDTRVVFDGLPTGFLDILDRGYHGTTFDTRALEAALDAGLNVRADPNLNTGPVTSWQYARAHPAIFDTQLAQGDFCFGRVLLWPHRYLPGSVAGGDARFSIVVVDEERVDFTQPAMLLWFYRFFAAICHGFGLLAGTNPHAIHESATRSGFHPSVNRQIYDLLDLFYYKFGWPMQGGLSLVQAYDAQHELMRGPDGTLPYPSGDKLGASINLNSRNSSMPVAQCEALNTLRFVRDGIADIHLVPAGGRLAAPKNDPVIQRKRAVLGIPNSALVG